MRKWTPSALATRAIDVWLRLQRDPDHDAICHDDLPGAQDQPPAWRPCEKWHFTLAAPGREDPGDGLNTATGGQSESTRCWSSTQHNPEISQEQIRAALTEQVILPELPAEMVDSGLNIYTTPLGAS